jgi:hypothetical protein
MRRTRTEREKDSDTGITARLADREIAHLEKIFRSAHRDEVVVDSAPYWRRRIEHLRAAPLLLPQQKARLDTLLVGLAMQPAPLPTRAYY